MGSDKFLDSFGDAEVEPLVNLDEDEQDEEEAERLESVEDLVEASLPSNDRPEPCPSLVLGDCFDVERLSGSRLASSTSSPTSSTVTKSSMLKLCSSKRQAFEEILSFAKSS